MNNKKADEIILLAHGDGGLLTNQLLKKYFLPPFDNKILKNLTDSALFSVKSDKLAMTTDSFVVDPIFFPGGDIGKLAVCGTVNDLAVSGAKPLYITASFIIEEGFSILDLEKIIASMAETCKKAGVSIIGGDTKVVGRGQADKIFITTTGLGSILPEADLGYQRIKPDDVVIVNGSLGNHGVSILIERESFNFETKIVSDCAPLNLTTERILKKFKGIKFMRDLTRGGLATNAKEIAQAAGVDITFKEEDIPVDNDVKGVSETLGLDPLYLANEGKFLIIVSKNEAEKMLKFLREELLEKDANIIGLVQKGKGEIYLKTALGGCRRLNMFAGAPLPRIC